MKKLLLIDVDSTIPNLALMKISTYYKKLKYKIELIKCNISYYPNRKKIFNLKLQEKYYKIYISAIFLNTIQYLNLIDEFDNDILYGGTGFNLVAKLPEYIEKCEPDYTIYPNNDVSYGFITRGCIRNCYFCFVPKKEGKIYFNIHPKEIIKHNKVKFMDNNILSYHRHLEILQWLVDNKVKCCFNQGLDIRLIDQENSLLLSKLKYIGEYIFAFDDWKYKNIIDQKLEILSWRKNWQLKFFIYCNMEMNISDTIKRIEYCKEKQILPYLMRDINCWESVNKSFYIDLAAWCNQPALFKNMTFEQFLNKRHITKERIIKSLNLYKRS